MATGSPIDASIRKITHLPLKKQVSVPDSKSDLDAAPQILMEAGDEQFSFQYPDGLGDGRDKYEGLEGGADAPQSGGTLIDTISAHIEAPKNKTYTLSYNVPFPIEILGHTHAFGSGSGVLTYQSGIINTGGSLNVAVSGVSVGAADLKIQVTVRTHQVS